MRDKQGELNRQTIPHPGALFATAITLALALVGLAWTVSEHRLDVRVLTDSALMSTDPDVSTSLTVRWKDREVSDLRLLEVTVENSGTEPITAADFDSPLTLSISPDDPGEILDARVVATDPSSLAPELQVSSTSVEVDPVLLNQGDGFSLKLITTSTSPLAVRAEARIAGVQDVKLEDARRLGANGEKLTHEYDLRYGDTVLLASNSRWQFLQFVAFILLLVCVGLIIATAVVSKTDDWWFRGRNVGFLAWFAVLGLVGTSYVFTLGARGVTIGTSAYIILSVTIGLGLCGALPLFVLSARGGRSIGPLPISEFRE